jgi:hypothetical protein
LVLEQPFDVYRFDFDESVFGYKKSLYNVWFAFTLPPGQTAAIMEPTKCTQLKWATVAEARELQRETSDIRNSTLIDKWEKLQSTLKG